MSAPPVPSFFASTAAVARMTSLRTMRGRKLRVALLATAVIILFPAVVALLGPDAASCAGGCPSGETCVDAEDRCEPGAGTPCPGVCVSESAHASRIVTGGIDWGFFRLLVFLLPILFTSGAIGEEVEARTLHFLSTRPVSRAAIAVGKYLVGTGAALAVLWAGLVLLHVVGYAAVPTAMIDQAGETARAGGAASLLVMAYSGICLLWGALVPEAAGMLSVVWLGFVEWFLVLLPGIIRMGSLNHFARELGGLPRAGWADWVPDVELWISATVVSGGWLLFTLLGILTVRFSELRFGKA